MADAAPVNPAAPAKPSKLVLSKALVWIVLVVNLAVVGGLAYEHFHRPHPPTPAPPKPPEPPKPPPPDPAPVAKVSGLFFPLPSVGAKGSPSVPLGLIRVSAEGSTSTHPIKWRTRGPAPLSLTVISPDGGLGGSIAEAYPTVPGTYRIHAIARGKTKGEPDADIDSYEVEVGDSPPAPDVPDKPDVPVPPPVKPDTPPNDPSIDPKFWTLGRAYSGTLSATYADALDSGATMLTAGTPLSQAMGTITQKWGAGRQAAFDKLLTPEFSKIIPESTKDADITAAQRDAMAKACRGLAAGLRK